VRLGVVILALRKPRQETHQFEVSLCYIVRIYLYKQNKTYGNLVFRLGSYCQNISLCTWKYSKIQINLKPFCFHAFPIRDTQPVHNFFRLLGSFMLWLLAYVLKVGLAGYWWLTPLILITQESDIGGITIKSHLGK
jgi:hypothetical protein